MQSPQQRPCVCSASAGTSWTMASELDNRHRRRRQQKVHMCRCAATSLVLPATSLEPKLTCDTMCAKTPSGHMGDTRRTSGTVNPRHKDAGLNPPSPDSRTEPLRVQWLGRETKFHTQTLAQRKGALRLKTQASKRHNSIGPTHQLSSQSRTQLSNMYCDPNPPSHFSSRTSPTPHANMTRQGPRHRQNDPAGAAGASKLASCLGPSQRSKAPPNLFRQRLTRTTPSEMKSAAVSPLPPERDAKASYPASGLYAGIAGHAKCALDSHTAALRSRAIPALLAGTTRAGWR